LEAINAFIKSQPAFENQQPKFLLMVSLVYIDITIWYTWNWI